MELLDVYDLEGRPTGRTVERSMDLKGLDFDSERLLLVHVCVFNSRGEMLLQRRAMTKDRYPGWWDVSAGGFVSAGEASEQAVRREIYEEIGFDASGAGIAFVHREPFGIVFDDFYAVYAEPELGELKLQSSEVMDAAWFDREEVLKMLHEKRFVDYPEELVMRMFDDAEKHLPR